MQKMFLDIETIPADVGKLEILQDLYRRRQEKNHNNSKPQTFEEYLESTGLDGSFGRICCLCYAINDGEVVTLSTDEPDILNRFWSAAKNVDLFVGFNIIDFDLRFIYQRSVVNQVKPTLDINFARFRNNPIYDVMHEWSKWSNLGRTSLHGLAKALGVESPKEGDIEGKDVAKAYAAGRIKEICEYCTRDVAATRSIYERLTFTRLT